MESSRRRALLLAASAVTLGLSAPAQAQVSGTTPVADQTSQPVETVIVTGQRYREHAIQQKEAAPNVIEVKPVQEIRKLPDVNVAEALQRMPGISMESDTGEGRFINIRGMDADLNGTTYDGVTLTASNQATPQGGARAVAFDAFPTGVIGGVEIVKSVTPDMNAEGLGGVINLQPRELPADGSSFLDAGLGSGFEPMRDRPIWQGDVTAGTTLDTDGDIGDGGPIGVLASYAYEEDHRGIDDVEEGYSLDPMLPYGTGPSKELNNLQLRWYEYHRIRQGEGGGVTWSPASNTTLYLRAIHAGYTEYADKHHLELQNLDSCYFSYCPHYDPSTASWLSPGAVAYQTFTDSDEHVGNDLVMFGGHSLLFGWLTADYRGSWTRGHDDFPSNWGAVFQTSPVPLEYNNVYSSSHITYMSGTNFANPANFTLQPESLQNTPSTSFDEEWSGALDFSLPLAIAGFDGTLKYGSELRRRERGVSQDQMTYDSPVPVSLDGLTVGSDVIYYNGFYNIGPNLNASAIETLPGLYLADPAGDALANGQAYEHDTENVGAAYIQYTGTMGPLGVLAGLRYEVTQGTYQANLTTVDASGNQTLTPNTNVQDYSNFFPSLQTKYRIDDDTLLRAAFSTAIARPGFNQITAAKTVDHSCAPNICISEGNPGLKPTTGDSFDLTLEHLLPNGGIASGNLFYKYFSDYIIPTTDTTTNPNGSQTITQSFSNIGPAFAEGVELDYVQYFTFLPQPMDGLGFDANMTENYARGDIRAGERHTLPQTSPLNYNAELFYEKGPLSLRIAASYVSANIFAVGPDWSQDVYAQPRFRVDFGSTYDITDNVQVYFNVKNLTNTVLEFTQTHSAFYPIQREFYGPTFFFGLRAQIGQGGFTHLSGEGDED